MIFLDQLKFRSQFICPTSTVAFTRLTQIPGAWKAFPAAAVSAGITFVVFASIWYRRIIINIASTTLVGLIAFMVMCFMDFQFYWIILIAGIILMIASIIFFNIRFTDRK